jgi:uncharacterized membrane protein YgcG
MTKTIRSALFLGAALSAIVTFTAISGCEDDDDVAVVTTGASCSTACGRYQACFNSAYDVAACTSSCQSAMANNTIVATDVDDCIDCIGANTCSPAFNCVDACDLVVVVPAGGGTTGGGTTGGGTTGGGTTGGGTTGGGTGPY